MSQSTSAIEQARKHFAGHAPKPFDVPEWGIKVYPKQENKQDRIKRNAFNKEKDFDSASSLAHAIILLALKADGSAHFKLGDRLALITETDPDVLDRVALACLGVSIEGAEKN